MLTRVFILAVGVPALVLFCAGCACQPDRWNVTLKNVRDPRTDRWAHDEVDVSLSGPIPTFHE